MNLSTVILKTALLLLLLVHGTDAKMNIISSKQDVQLGEEILLLCKAGGEGTITWQRNGDDVDDEDVVSKVDETSSKLHIKKATMQDTGTYRCHCEFENGHEDETDMKIYIYEGPSFGSSAVYHEFLVGTDGTVPCVVTGQPEVVVRWFKDLQEIPSKDFTLGRVRQLSDNALHIEKVKKEDAGTYRCSAQIKGRPISKNLSVSVVVNSPPTVRLKEEVKTVMAGPETNASLFCLVDGLPKPNITWTLPVQFDPSHHHYNSDKSQLTIRSVVKEDLGEYICTATNKIAEDTATITLQVFEFPGVFVSEDKLHVSVGRSVSVFCNVSGHPEPKLHWINKLNGRTLDQTSGRVRVENGYLKIDEIVPTDGGLYSCVAVGASGNASRDVEIFTQPGQPLYLTASPGPASVFFSLKVPPISGGAPITSYVLQWRQNPSEDWEEITVPTSDTLTITNLKPYTSYFVRLAAINAVGRGEFSDSNSIHTRGIREPESPFLSSGEVKVEGNSLSIPLKQAEVGGAPLQHYNIRYRQEKEGTEWKEMQLSSDADSVFLQDLAFGSDYQLQVTAVNANGSSLPSVFNFTVAEQPASRMTKGSVIGIVMFIFLVVFLVVDGTCCYRNRCGLLMTIARKLFGQKIPGLKMVEEGEGTTKGEVNLKGIGTMRFPKQTGVHTLTKEGQVAEVTCDKAPLTKHEKIQPDRELPIASA
ncbi:neural cell adhesion molecule 1 isoform X2 [Mugil cephalus]|uniref:neural cell adhesion molecule 1 isoform X2 n=1 Tax=Mugil cephalus TaxID=48193 RepID=UPI001FB75939|nr:neural cell adhesion molecule 1 isoform X2 [Mugil cephalus]